MLVCAIKPMCAWNLQETATTCRERCGGQGYLSCNRFGHLVGFAHAGMTAEGDNRVLMQKVCPCISSTAAIYCGLEISYITLLAARPSACARSAEHRTEPPEAFKSGDDVPGKRGPHFAHEGAACLPCCIVVCAMPNPRGRFHVYQGMAWARAGGKGAAELHLTTGRAGAHEGPCRRLSAE